MGGTKQDEDLTLLLTKLYTIQEQVGAKEKSSDEEKQNRAQQAGQHVAMGKGKKGKKTGSRFLELKSSIVDSLKTVHGVIEEQGNSRGKNPKEAIAAQAEIRELIRQASDEWEELNQMYKKEARKKKSKFTVEELEVQQALVMQLNQEIEKVKEAQLAGFARGGSTSENAQLNLGALAALDAADLSSSADGGGKSWTPGTTGTAMTGSQQVQLQQIHERDAEFDQDLDELGEGIQDLHELALRQGEEVQRQNAMLAKTDSALAKTQDHMDNVNSKMKETLEEVGRSSDKLCVDIMCILLMVGFGAVFYKMAQGGWGN